MYSIPILAAQVPIVVPRQCGGWLAVSPRQATLRIAVTAATEGEAKRSFTELLGRWVCWLSDGVVDGA